ncbi:AraC family transcriptional regulator N-terminal domain-containing protein [Rhizobium pisi]|uniref:AraC family transcriptional regulator n=1 Tax=Rhizobium pisi TaxID=574561 RepID=UPI0039B00691
MEQTILSSSFANPEPVQIETGSFGKLVGQVRTLAICAGQIVTPSPDIWVFRTDSPISYVRSYSSMMNIAVAVSGQKTVRIGNHIRVNDPKNYLLMHGSTHYQASVDASPDAPYIALKLQLSPGILGPILLELADLGGLRDDTFDPPPPVFVGPVEDTFAEPLCRLLTCLDHPLERRMLVPLYLREIAFRLLRSDAASLLRASITREHTRVLRAIRFIEENADAGITVQAMAESVAMSGSHFAHRFREITGVSPIQYLKRIRLEKARLLLLEGDLSVSIAAEETGYASTSHFSRDFRRQFGLSPTGYVQSFKEHVAVTS